MKPLRILHVVGSMARGGVETWLLHMLRHTERSHLHMDFLTLHGGAHAYDDEVRALGGRLLHCPGYQRPWRFARTFLRLVRAYGPYDVIHCHLQEYSGFVLWLAQRAAIPARIAHSHSDTTSRWVQRGLLRRLYLRQMQRWLARCATLRLAVSTQAAGLLFAASGSPWQHFPCSIDLAPFDMPADARQVRAELGIAPDALVIGHVGRFVTPKNHRLLIEIAAHAVAAEPRAVLLLVGDGPLRPEVAQQARQAGLEGRVIFAGSRPDVARLLRGAIDVFVLPSHYEGLGLAGVEAQAAGLPCLFSNRVPPEADVVAPLVQRLSLNEPPAIWARAALAAGRRAAPIAHAAALAAVRQQGFDSVQGARRLERLYYAEVNRGRCP